MTRRLRNTFLVVSLAGFLLVGAAPARAAEAETSSDFLTGPESSAKSAAIQKLDTMPAPQVKSPALAFALDGTLPGLGTYYTTHDGGKALDLSP